MVGARTWARVPHEIGEPISLEISSEMPCMSLRMASATLVRIAPRSAGSIRGQGPWSNASRATATARSTSATWASGTRPTSCSVVGDTTSNTEEDDGSAHSPPMNRRSYDFTGPPWLDPGVLRSAVESPRGGAATVRVIANCSPDDALAPHRLEPRYAPMASRYRVHSGSDPPHRHRHI